MSQAKSFDRADFRVLESSSEGAAVDETENYLASVALVG
jgi:hypothetical protein